MRPDSMSTIIITMRKASKLTEEEIDEIVIAQAGDDDAWGPPLRIRKPPMSKQAREALVRQIAERAQAERHRQRQGKGQP